MLKEYIAVIVLHLLLIDKAKAKEDEIKIEKLVTHGGTSFDDAIGNCTTRPGRVYDAYVFNPPTNWFEAMSNCKLHGLNLYEMAYKPDYGLLSVPGSNFEATSEQNWFWCGLNAIENIAYGEDVEVPEFIWRWFLTGEELRKDARAWIAGEPKQEFDKDYQTYVGCAAVDPDRRLLKTFNCRTPLQYICETNYET